MKKEASLQIRLDAQINRKLDIAAKRLGLTKSALIRILILSFVDQLEANGGKIVMPLQWKTQLLSDDSITLRRVAEDHSKYGEDLKGKEKK